MKPSVQTTVSYVIAGAAGGVVACLFVLTAVLFYQVADTGSAADWIAAIANVAMAITAALAFVVARSWLPQLTTQEGYKLAIRLVNDDVLTLGEDNLFLHNVHTAIEAFTVLKPREQRVRGETVLKALWDVHAQADNQVGNIQRLQKQMDTYGLVPASGRSKAFSEMMHALNDFSCQARAQWVLLSVIARGGLDSDKLSDLLEIDELAMISQMAEGTAWTELSKENLAKLDTAWEMMTTQQKHFLGKDSRIGKLFTVRRQTGSAEEETAINDTQTNS